MPCGKIKMVVSPLCRACADKKRVTERTHCPYGHEYTLENTYIYQGRRQCRECSAVRKRGPERRKRTLADKGLTPETFDAILAAQEFRCINEGCRTDKPGKRGWQIDHDHDCCEFGCALCIRGIACHLCNTLGDNVGMLKGWIAYAGWKLGSLERECFWRVRR